MVVLYNVPVILSLNTIVLCLFGIQKLIKNNYSLLENWSLKIKLKSLKHDLSTRNSPSNWSNGQPVSIQRIINVKTQTDNTV